MRLEAELARVSKYEWGMTDLRGKQAHSRPGPGVPSGSGDERAHG